MLARRGWAAHASRPNCHQAPQASTVVPCRAAEEARYAQYVDNALRASTSEEQSVKAGANTRKLERRSGGGRHRKMEVPGAEFGKAGAKRKMLQTVLAPPTSDWAKSPALKAAARAPTVA